MVYRDTTPVPKYGPTPVYGDCETASCESSARTTCTSCGGDYCFGHADHAGHDSRATTSGHKTSADSSR